MAPLQEGASRALKPARDLVGWTGDVFDAKSENKDLQEARSSSCAPSSPRLADRAARRRAAARAGRLQPLRRASRPATTTVAARVIGRSPTVWYSTITIDKGSDQGVHVDQPVVSGDGLVGKVSDVAPDAARVTLITDHTSGVSAQVVPDGAERPREGDGRQPVRPDPRLRAEGPRGAQGRDRGHLRAGAPRSSSRCSRAASRSASVTHVDADERELYQRVHLRPFADLRELDIVEVLTARLGAPARTRRSRRERELPGTSLRIAVLVLVTVVLAARGGHADHGASTRTPTCCRS